MVGPTIRREFELTTSPGSTTSAASARENPPAPTLRRCAELCVDVILRERDAQELARTGGGHEDVHRRLEEQALRRCRGFRRACCNAESSEHVLRLGQL